MEFQYNDKKHSAIGYILFELNFGRCSIKKRPNNRDRIIVRNRLATEPVMLKVCNIKLSFDI